MGATEQNLPALLLLLQGRAELLCAELYCAVLHCASAGRLAAQGGGGHHGAHVKIRSQRGQGAVAEGAMRVHLFAGGGMQ